MTKVEVSDVAGTTWQFIFLVAGILGNMAAVVCSRIFLRALGRREHELAELRLEVKKHREVLIREGLINPATS